MDERSMPEENINSIEMSGSWIGSVKRWLEMCSLCQYEENAHGWFRCCEIVLKEIKIIIIEEQYKYFKEKKREAEIALNKHNAYLDNFRRDAPKEMKFNPPREIVDILYEWETKMREVLKGYLLGER
jgi:hypothetical protein